MKRIFASLAILAIAVCSFAAKGGSASKKPAGKNGYEISLEVKDMKDTPVYLAFYYNGKTYSKDTLQLNSKGVGSFKKDTLLHQGVYIVYFNPNKYFDLLVGENQKIQVVVDTAKLDPKVLGAKESVAFQELVNFMGDMHKKQRELSQSYKDKKIDSTKYADKSKVLNDEVEDYQKNALAQNQGNFFGAFLKGTIPVDVPDFKEIQNDTTRIMTRYRYGRDHYFDNVDLADPRMLRTPYFSSKVDGFMKQYAERVDPDTSFMLAKRLIEASKGNRETFQTMTSKMINFGLTSNIMGMEKYWIKIADEYYFSGQATWSDSSWVEDLRKEAKKHRHNMIGMTAHDLMLRDSLDNIIKISDIKSDLVLVYFYEPSCGHCKKTTPILHDSVYAKYKDKGFEVIACYTQIEKPEWMKFVKDHKLDGWKNVWDPYRESYFWEYFDASSTPGVYLLDKDRKIIAKKIDMKVLGDILNYELVEKKGIKEEELKGEKPLREKKKKK